MSSLRDEGKQLGEPPRLLVRWNDRVWALEGIAIESVEPFSTISEVPASALGMALVRGQVVPVLRLSMDVGPLVVGCVRNEIVALSGVQVIGLESERDSKESAATLNVEDYLSTLKH